MIIKKLKTSQEVFRPNVWGHQKKKKKRKKRKRYAQTHQKKAWEATLQQQSKLQSKDYYNGQIILFCKDKGSIHQEEPTFIVSEVLMMAILSAVRW